MNWISVEDRLPLELSNDDTFRSVDVLVTDGNFVTVYSFTAGGTYSFETGLIRDVWRNWSDYGDIESSTITHWMPLPEPPEDN